MSVYRQRLQVIAREAGFPIEDYGDAHFVVTPEVIGELRELSYAEQWRLAIDRRWYHVKMQDHSLFLFAEGRTPSYSFLHCPIDVVSFPDYLRSMGQLDVPSARREYLGMYQEVFDTARERRHVTPIRFDYDPNGYSAGVHPVAHVHIGLENQVRLCSNKMSAASFVLFVMRHMYPAAWSRLLQRDQRDFFIRPIRDPATRVEDEFWTELDRIELHMNSAA